MLTRNAGWISNFREIGNFSASLCIIEIVRGFCPCMKEPMLTTLAALTAMTFVAPESGLKPGESVSPFHPTHVAGPLAGSTDCFPCTFQNRPQVQVWVNGDDSANVKSMMMALSKAVEQNKSKEFKAMVVLLAPAGKKAAVIAKAKSMVSSTKIPVALAVLETTDEAVSNYKVNTSADVKNTVFVYKNWKVANTMVNLKADSEGLKSLNGAIAKVVG
jgi:hypothetical protein